MTTGLVLEGVSGAGKTQILRVLTTHPAVPTLLGAGRVFPEEETFGEFMDERRDPALRPAERLARLHRVLRELRAGAATPLPYGYILERFHPSYYALLPDRRLYAAVDRALAALGGKVVLLTYDPDHADRRTLDRRDRTGTGWTEDLVAFFGSRQAAVEAVLVSQRRRQAYLAASRLPSLELDTTSMDWATTADRIVGFWRGDA